MKFFNDNRGQKMVLQYFLDFPLILKSSQYGLNRTKCESGTCLFMPNIFLLIGLQNPYIHSIHFQFFLYCYSAAVSLSRTVLYLFLIEMRWHKNLEIKQFHKYINLLKYTHRWFNWIYAAQNRQREGLKKNVKLSTFCG